MVPLTNLWLWLVVYFGKGRWPVLLGWLSGAAAGVAAFYSILYLPFAPFSAMAIIYFGIGLIPLAPYFALLFTLLLRWQGQAQFPRRIIWPVLAGIWNRLSCLALAQSAEISYLSTVSLVR